MNIGLISLKISHGVIYIYIYIIYHIYIYISWSDIAVFHIGGFVNCHNWVGEDPRITSENMQNRPKVAVWCGITSDRIVAHFILRNTVNVERYLTMLRGNLASYQYLGDY